MEIYVIPTHRVCEQAVRSIVEEMSIIKESANNSGILILDNSKNETFEENRKALIRIQKQEKLNIYHIGMDEIENIILEITNNCNISKEELMEMLYPDKIDYGKIFNLIYLTAILLGADTIHRRDSDCYVWKIEKKNYPLQIEKQYIGKLVKSIEGVYKQENIDYSDEEKVCIVGGDYIGNWDLDTQKVNEANPEAMKYMMRICGITEEKIEEQFNIKYQEQAIVSEIPLLSSLFEVSQSPECGNISMHEIYKYIPNFVGENGVGFDNHTYFIAFQVKVPIIFHYNRILHMHDENRTKDIDLFHYWRGIAKMVDFDTYHLEFIQSGYADMLCQNGYGINAIKENYTDQLPDLLEKTLTQIDRDTRIKRIEIIAEKVLRPTKIEVYSSIADYLQREKETIINQLDYEYRLSIKLQRNWRCIVTAVEEISKKKPDFTSNLLLGINYCR